MYDIDFQRKVMNVSRQDMLGWSSANSAFLEAIRHEPHPLRTLKIHKKRNIDILKYAPERAGSPGEFKQFRTKGLSGLGNMIGPACSDLTFMLKDNPRVFVIAEKLGNLLRQTELRGAETDRLRLPFRTIYLQLPKNDIPILFQRDDKSLLDGVYVTEEDQNDGTRLLLFLATGAYDGAPVADDTLFTFPFFLNAGGTLEEQLRDRIAELTSRKEDEVELANVERFPEIFTWAFNCLLYITSADADLKEEWLNQSAAQKMKKASGPKKAKIRNMLETTSIRITRVGAAMQSSQEPVGTHASPALHWVHGFWRNQVCGVGRSERRHKWIKPFLRGEGREIVSKMYDVR